MSGDLVSLGMLVVSAYQANRDLWRQGAGLASVPIDLLEADAATAAKALAKGGVDIVVLDAALPDADKHAAVRAARSKEPSPFVVISTPNGAGRVDGADATISKPSNAEEVRVLVEQCIRVKIPTRVLVVDDSGTMRKIVRKILAASRYALEIDEAEEGLAALDLLRTGKFGIVFLDYNMPGLNGLETLSEIRRAVPDVAVVMITSTMDESVADRARTAGALAFLKKPFYPADIDGVLERHYGFAASAA